MIWKEFITVLDSVRSGVRNQCKSEDEVDLHHPVLGLLREMLDSEGGQLSFSFGEGAITPVISPRERAQEEAARKRPDVYSGAVLIPRQADKTVNRVLNLDEVNEEQCGKD